MKIFEGCFHIIKNPEVLKFRQFSHGCWQLSQPIVPHIQRPGGQGPGRRFQPATGETPGFISAKGRELQKDSHILVGG